MTDNEQWAMTTTSLAEAANVMLILSRCLDVGPQLDEWRQSSSDVAGGDAANALDQAKGMLERLIGGDAAKLLTHVEAVLEELPPSWD